MNRNLIRLSVAAALGMLSTGAAFAASITYPSADPDPMIVNFSGATATDVVLSDALINDSTSSLCDSSVASIEVYTTEASWPAPSATNYAIACHTRASGLTVANAQNIDIIFRKYSGGSGSGISQVASGAALANDAGNNRNWVDVIGCHSTGTGVAVGAAPGRQAYTLYLGCAPTSAGRVTHGGISDVEPALLGASATQISQLSINSGVAVDFSPVLSTALYGALQTAQNLKTAASGFVTACSTSDQTPECVPNLSSSQLRGIFKGNITTGAILFANPAGAGATTALPTSGGTANIFVCRRGNSSGTQTSYQVHFLRQGCGTAGVGSPSLAFVGASGAGSTNGCTPSGCGWSATYQADRVFAGTGASDVVSCVNYHSGVSHYAVGVLSTEVLADDGNNAAFRHVKVDGALPSLENVQSGLYDFFTEDTVNLPNSTSGGWGSMSAQQKDIPNALLGGIRTAGSIKASLVSHPWGYGGVLAIPQNANASPNPPAAIGAQHAQILSNPTNSQTRAASYGGAPNNCNPAWEGTRTLLPIDTVAY